MKDKIAKWKNWAKNLKSDIYALYFAYKDPQVPLFAKAFIVFLVGYAFSPIDLIPDFVPVLGYLDDLIILPLGVYLAIKMVPSEVLEESRIKAREAQSKPVSWLAGVVIIFLWIIIISLLYFKFLS